MNDDVSFGMTEQDLKNQKVKSIFQTVKNFFDLIGPTVIRWISILIYYTIKFIRSVVVNVIRMILGKEI